MYKAGVAGVAGVAGGAMLPETGVAGGAMFPETGVAGDFLKIIGVILLLILIALEVYLKMFKSKAQ